MTTGYDERSLVYSYCSRCHGRFNSSTGLYPRGWPKCVRCGDDVIDGHSTCGRFECNSMHHLVPGKRSGVGNLHRLVRAQLHRDNSTGRCRDRENGPASLN
jgi:hypothetical protein